MRCLLVHLTAVGISISEHVAGELYYHHLHAETYTECRYVVRTGIFGGNNFSLYTSLSKSRADDNAILSGKHLSNILVVYLLRVDECQYGLPVVGMVKKGKEYICLVDSGSNLNITTKYVLGNGDITNRHTGLKSSLTSVAGTKMTDLMILDFDLLSIGNKIGEIKVMNYSAEFQVMDNSKYILEGSSNIPPVSAIIGAGFLLEHKWVVDFASGVVYSAKN